MNFDSQAFTGPDYWWVIDVVGNSPTTDEGEIPGIFIIHHSAYQSFVEKYLANDRQEVKTKISH